MFLTSIDGFRVVAGRSPLYAGQEGPFWCGEDGKWVDVWLSKEKPSAAKVGVVRRSVDGQLTTTSAVALWSEYGSDKNVWAKMPALMLAKCAEALALRKCFPNDLSGLYTADELDQAEIKSEPTTGPRHEENAKKLDAIIGEVLDVVPEETPEKPPAPSREAFMKLLEDKGVQHTETAIRIVKSSAMAMFSQDDPAKLSQMQLTQLYTSIQGTDPDDLIPF